MPELRDINWNVIGDYEIQIIHDCVKETNIRNAVNEEYLEYLQVAYFKKVINFILYI